MDGNRIGWYWIRLLKKTNWKAYGKIDKDNGLKVDNDVKNTLPGHLVSFNLSIEKRIMNYFIGEKNGSYNISIYFGDTDSLYIEIKYWDVLHKANLLGKKSCQGKNYYKTGGIFYGILLGPKINYCLTFNEFGIVQQHMASKGPYDSEW